MNDIDELLTRGVANIIPNKDELKKTLESGKKLNVYLGIDPTSTKIHLGHAVPLRKLQKLAELGHHVTFLIGDFTALIGDTSDKDSERPVLTKEQIEENFQTYKKQAEKILDFTKVNVRFNSEWLNRVSLEETIKLCHNFSAGDFAGRELIAKRLKDGKHVGLHEFLYPVLQGYDSYFMDTDIQVGGTDQTFNMQAGRELQKKLRNKESFVLANPFLEGTDGRKMSKTWGNAIWLDDEPSRIYEKIMSIKDDLIIDYFTLATNTSLAEIKEIEKELKNGSTPMPAKKQLAYEIVLELHGVEAADEAQNSFQKIVQDKDIPIDLYTPKDFVSTVLDVISDLITRNNRSQAKRLVEQGGVSINDKKINMEEANGNVEEGMIIKIGKRRVIKIKPLSVVK
jgi:tyrosyl-tRNA synthetase